METPREHSTNAIVQFAIVFTVLLTGFLLYFVMPRLEFRWGSTGTAIPLWGLVGIRASHFLIRYLFVVVPGVLAALVALVFYNLSPRSKGR